MHPSGARTGSVAALAVLLLVAPLAQAQGQGAATSSNAAPPAASPASKVEPAPATRPDAAPAPAAAPSVATLLAEVDASWPRRDQPGKMDLDLELLEKAEKIAPGDYEVLWRLARHYYWLADDPSIKDEERARLGKLTWDWADKANAANPARVEGWFYGSAGVGMYAVGISIIKALFDGMEGKYLDRLKKAQSIDPAFYLHGAYVSWGRYYYELPWPKYNDEKSEMYLKKALDASPGNLRAQVYLAELYFKEGRPADARQLIDDVLSSRPGAYDPPEERRAQGMARVVLAKNK